jgi:hypothetical protein
VLKRIIPLVKRNYSDNMGVKHFRLYMPGKACDHKPFMWIMSVKDRQSRLTGWRIQLEEYDYEVLYKKVALNINADALSRMDMFVKDGTKISAINIEETDTS